jgi:hypothetical protein
MVSDRHLCTAKRTPVPCQDVPMRGSTMNANATCISRKAALNAIEEPASLSHSSQSGLASHESRAKCELWAVSWWHLDTVVEDTRSGQRLG